jgi:hypothetical protein
MGDLRGAKLANPVTDAPAPVSVDEAGKSRSQLPLHLPAV